MSAIHDLIAQIDDSRLRERLSAEWVNASQNKKFGLVFEEHLPELLPLYGVQAKKGDLVCKRSGPLKDVWQVKSVLNGMVTCVKPQDETHPSVRTRIAGKEEKFPVADALVVKEFGEPIFPTLTPIDEVRNGSNNSPSHALIEADNYHALELLDYLYANKVDCIYIDPPYNSGARDWKYNNDYVDKNDGWRHSKWLAFMERRLRIAKKLLRSDDSVLIIAIDDNELFTLGLLLDELFKECDRQIVNVTINPKGKARDGRLSQVDEYLLIVYIGDSAAQEISVVGSEVEVRWPYLRRSDVESARGTKKGGVRQFYPIYVNEKSGKIVSIGDALSPNQDLSIAPRIKGAVAVFPIREDGKHMNWGLTGSSLQHAVDNGFVKVSRSKNPHQQYNFSYLTGPSIKKVESGIYKVIGLREDGTKIVVIPGGKNYRGTTSWKKNLSHTNAKGAEDANEKNLYDANAYGSQLIGSILPDRKFPFPKSIYSVFDALKLFVGGKPNALVIDFFAGSGTTLHAINLLNASDEGKRQCVLVTNNEVSAEEAEFLRKQGSQPGDADWEAHGICRSVTWPRSKFSILGTRNDGKPIIGEYFTGRVIRRECERNFYHIGFVDPASFRSIANRKQLLSLIGDLPQNLVKDSSPFIISQEKKVSILFDPEFATDWILALDEFDDIDNFYIVTQDKKLFDRLKSSVIEVKGGSSIYEDERRPASLGFEANVAYFKLDFLDKDRVTLRRAFKEILPLLWLQSGAIGKKPEVGKNAVEPAIFDSADGNFIVLLEESRFPKMLKSLTGRSNIVRVFIVTDADESFKAMRQEVMEAVGESSPDLIVIQLYRDYLSNFMINKNNVFEANIMEVGE